MLPSLAENDWVPTLPGFAAAASVFPVAVAALIVNRMHPPYGEADPTGDETAENDLRTTAGGDALADYHRARADLRRLASEERANLAELTAQVATAAIVYVPSLATDVHDLAGLNRVGESLLAPDAS